MISLRKTYQTEKRWQLCQNLEVLYAIGYALPIHPQLFQSTLYVTTAQNALSINRWRFACIIGLDQYKYSSGKYYMEGITCGSNATISSKFVIEFSNYKFVIHLEFVSCVYHDPVKRALSFIVSIICSES